jgi:molecular chaperone DnaK
VEARNEADALVYTTEKALKEHGSALDAAERRTIDDAIAKVKETLKSGGASDIRREADALKTASYKLGEKMYASSQGAAGDPSQAGPEPGDDAGDGGPGAGPDTVVDADYEVVDDEEKK